MSVENNVDLSLEANYGFMPQAYKDEMKQLREQEQVETEPVALDSPVPPAEPSEIEALRAQLMEAEKRHGDAMAMASRRESNLIRSSEILQELAATGVPKAQEEDPEDFALRENYPEISRVLDRNAEKTRKQIMAEVEQLRTRELDQRSNAVKQAMWEAVPNPQALFNDPEFLNGYLGQNYGMPKRLLDDAIARGDSRAAIEIVKGYQTAKTSSQPAATPAKPSLSEFATPARSHAGAPSRQAEKYFSSAEFTEKTVAYHANRMPVEKYEAYVAEFRKALNEGRVVD
jgi:hypothetical protein